MLAQAPCALSVTGSSRGRMKFLLGVLPCAALAGLSQHGSPVTRVVNMLKELDGQLEADGEAEKDLFQKYTCWAESTVTEKTSAVETAKQRISALSTYIADVEAGKITFTSDKEDLEQDLARIRSELTNITAERAEEHKTFEVNKADMEKAIAGLKEVMTSLKATSLGKKSALLSLRGGAVERVAQAHRLQEGLAAGDRYLSKSNRQFLHRLFTAKALSTESGAVQARGVVEQLAKVESSIEDDWSQDVKSEATADDSFKKMSTLKEEEKETAAALLAKLEKEHAARGQAIANSKEELESLKAQVEADEKLIPEVQTALEDKKSQFDERSSYRLGELKAIGEAVSMLTDDANRDLFASSFSFLQLSSVSASARKALSTVYKASQDQRVFALDMLLRTQDASEGGFDQVVAKIEDMITLLKKEDADELKKKDSCLANKKTDEASKKASERSLEDLETSISFSKGKLEEIANQMQVKKDEIAAVESQLAKALEVRDAEKAEFTKAANEDKAAIELLKQAGKKISDFYASKASLAQKTAVELSGAPKTWEGAYGGAGSQSTGVVHTMEVLAGDLQKEMEVGAKEEAEAEALYKDAKADLESQKSGLESARDQLAKEKGEAESAKEDAAGDKKMQSETIAALVQKMKDVEPECDYYVANFEKRSANRMTEVKGLAQAKAILEGSLA
mmetsp:Transcript_110659/g.263852  ORF Transcript_110659/g.263852 Transcript_110659/m.263852 type:complete len:682 (-) Transcript_110659:62-2107(-)